MGTTQIFYMEINGNFILDVWFSTLQIIFIKWTTFINKGMDICAEYPSILQEKNFNYMW
jgi:hypothetical protein